MVIKVHPLITTLLVTAITVTDPVTGQTGEITVTPDNRVTPSTEVSLQCGIDRYQYPGAYVIWRKKIGSITLLLGTNNGLRETFISSRYTLSASTDGSVDTYTLAITDAHYEDSGTYTCTRGFDNGEGTASSVSLSVCDDTDSPSCKCMDTEGWGSPSCFEQPEEVQAILDRYQGAIIGVVICLIIAIIYGVIVSVMLSRDCLNRMKLKAKKKLDAMQNDKMSHSQSKLNEPSEIPYDGSQQDGPHQGLYHLPQQPVRELGASSFHQYYDHDPQNQTVSVEQHPTLDRDSHYHGLTGRQGHDNQGFHSEEEKPYTQLKPPQNEIPTTRAGTSPHSPGVSDSSTDSWGQGARPKTSYKYPQTLSAPDTRQNQPGSHSPRQTGRQNIPKSVTHSPRTAGTPTNRDPGQRNYQSGDQKSSGKKRQAPQPGQESRLQDHRAPHSEQEHTALYHGQESRPQDHRAPHSGQESVALYPGQEHKAHGQEKKVPYHGQENRTPHNGQDQNRAVHHTGKGAPGKYDTYESGLSTISQQTHTHHPTPQSTHSEQLASSPGGSGIEVKHRGAFTDVTHNHQHKDEDREGFSVRGHYTQPRKLEYVNGAVPSKGAYVSETDTMI